MTLSTVRKRTRKQPLVLAIIRDVTDRKRAEAEHRSLLQEQAARAHAEATLRMRDEFVSVAAHELRTPLTALSGSVQLLQRVLDKRGTVSDGQLRDWLRVIEARGLSLDARRIELTQLTQAIVEMKQADTNRHQIHFSPVTPIHAEIDPLRVEQVLAILLDNAIKYSPRGRITVEAQNSPDGIEISVSDEGSGVAPEHRARIFERSYRGHEQVGLPGLGLGLYVARYIAEAHGGSLAADFPAAGGSRFTLSIPHTR